MLGFSLAIVGDLLALTGRQRARGAVPDLVDELRLFRRLGGVGRTAPDRLRVRRFGVSALRICSSVALSAATAKPADRDSAIPAAKAERIAVLPHCPNILTHPPALCPPSAPSARRHSACHLSRTGLTSSFNCRIVGPDMLMSGLTFPDCFRVSECRSWRTRWQCSHRSPARLRCRDRPRPRPCAAGPGLARRAKRPVLD